MRFWALILAGDVALLAAYAAWAASVETTAVIAPRLAWLALVLATFDLSIAAWMNGVRAFRTSKSSSSWVSLLAGLAVFVAACALLAIFIEFGLPQGR